MAIVRVLIVGLAIVVGSPAVSALIEGIYCGKDNCYDVLGVNREATKNDITKAYRALARKYHPDVHKTAEAKKEAEAMFVAIATAYEILKDDESRQEYNDMLDNPDQIYRHYYHYYRRRMAPKVDVRIVIAATITVISVIQYLTAWSRYNTAINYLVTVPKYRMQAKEIAKNEGLLDNNAKRKARKSKEELKEEEENVLKKIIEEKMDIKGAYAKPSVYSILWVQIVFLPYTTYQYGVWYSRWIWKFTINKEEYGEEEKLYLIRKNLGLSETGFSSLEDHTVSDYMKKQLWKKDEFKTWKAEQEEEMRVKLSQNARYKSYRRYMKNHGPGQITFDE